MVMSNQVFLSKSKRRDWKGLVRLPHILPPPTAGWCGCKREEQSPKTGSHTVASTRLKPTYSLGETVIEFCCTSYLLITQEMTPCYSSGHLRDARDPVPCEGRSRLERAGADQRGGLPPGPYHQQDHDYHCHQHPLCRPYIFSPFRIMRSWAS